MLQYDPGIFTQVTSLQQAKRIILTDERELDTQARWEKETPHICDLIDSQVRLTEGSVVLDFGCGVGRIAKELICRHGCWVVGADIAPNMQALAASYVGSDRFIACHPAAIPLLELRIDVALAVWVLQHSEDVARDLFLLSTAMTQGRLFVVNERSGRFVPTAQGWASDGMDIGAELAGRFKLMTDGHLSPDVVGAEQSQRTFWAMYRQ